ncbi:MAG: hypothetical protein ABID61_05625 [Candidatus Micrarchaeota archaeon]
MILITAQQQIRPPTMREHVKACGGFGSYLKESRAISRLEDMLRYPTTHPGQEGQEVFREGMRLFSGLTPVGKEKVMLELAHDLKSIRSYPFDSPEATRKLTTLANFFTEATELLPKDEQGDICNGPHIPAITSIKDLFEADSFYDHTNPEHVAAKEACLKALWNLGYGYIGFWEPILLANDTVSKQCTVDMWLNEPIKNEVPFEEHPWSLLRKHFDSISQELLQSKSPKKFEFFQRMLFDEDQSVVKKTLQLLVYSTDLPEHFFRLAQDISRTYPDLAPQGNLLHAIIECRNKLSEVGDGQYSAALQLLAFYQRGLSYLGPMLQEAGAEMLSNYHEPNSTVSDDPAERISTLAMVGIKIPGSRLSSVPVESQPDLEAHRGADVEELWQLSIQELNILSRMIWAGRNTVSADEEQELEAIGAVALVKIKQIEEQRKALNVLVQITQAGISIDGFRLNIVTPGGTQEQNSENPLYAYIGASADVLQTLNFAQLKELNEIVCSIKPRSEDELIELDKIASVATRKLEQSGIFNGLRTRSGPIDSPPAWLMEGTRGSPLRFSRYLFADGNKVISGEFSFTSKFLRVPWMEDSKSWLTDYLYQIHSHRLRQVGVLLRQIEEPFQLLADLDHEELVTLREFVSGNLPVGTLPESEQLSMGKLISATMLKLYQRFS